MMYQMEDTVATINSYSPTQIMKSLTIDNVAHFLSSLGIEIIQNKNYIILPTICHNRIEDATSMKLYYYDANKSFHCYTQCGENLNIFELYLKYMELNHGKVSFNEAVYYVSRFLKTLNPKIIPFQQKNNFNFLNYQVKIKDVQLPTYNENSLQAFIKYHHPLWLSEGISENSMNKFEISYSILQNQIVIPHRDIKGRLVGIRGRALDEDDIKQGKYRPVYIGDTMYSHPLGFNLYGLFQHASAIKRYQRAVIYESEKSVLKDDGYYGEDSVAVAVCGSNLNKFQVMSLVRNFGVNEIILAFDKEYQDYKTTKARDYRIKLTSICRNYNFLTDFSYVFDEENLLKEKDSPIDRGRQVWEKLYQTKFKVV